LKIKSIKIQNFRSIKYAEFNLYDYSVLVGANNSGKSNIITALRVFYEDGIKFDEKRDYPKFLEDEEDMESWIEIEYKLTDGEFNTLEEKYRGPDNTLKVRKYLKSKDRVKPNQSNIYGYKNGKLSDSPFYGAKNVSQAKLGTVIYVPELAKTDDTLKLTGPSPLRNILSFVMEKVVKKSKSFNSLNEAFDEFNEKFQGEASKEGVSLENFRKELNDNLKEWGVEFNININPIKPKDIIKNLTSYNFIDKILGKEMDVNLYGQGLQRQFIYTLIRLSAQYKEEKGAEKKEFSPELTLILFEEPETFLHPTQQELLNFSLKSLSKEEGQQIIITTHSPTFVSKNIEDISALIRLKRNERGVTQVFQVSESTLDTRNNELAQFLQSKLKDPSVSESTKKRIKDILGDTDEGKRMEEESIRFLLWLDVERCRAFFADIVLICEGATEKTFIEYLIKNEWHDLRQKKIYVLDALGKYNIHRYMNLFKELGINHSVLADKDKDKEVHKFINHFIERQKNEYTKSIDFFDEDIETFLGISKPPANRRDKKPLNVMWHYYQRKISEDKIKELKSKIEALL